MCVSLCEWHYSRSSRGRKVPPSSSPPSPNAHAGQRHPDFDSAADPPHSWPRPKLARKHPSQKTRGQWEQRQAPPPTPCPSGCGAISAHRTHATCVRGGGLERFFFKGRWSYVQRKRMVVGARGGWVDQVAGALGLPGLDLVPERQARCAEPPREPEALVRVGKEGFPRGRSMEAGPAPFPILHAHATRGRSPLLPLWL